MKLKSSIYGGLLCAVSMLLLGNGCTTTPVDVLAVACDSTQEYQAERCAKALVDTYQIYQKQALEAVSNPSLDDVVKTSIADAELVASQAMLEVNRANITYIQTKEILSRKPDSTASDQEQAIQQEAMLNDLVRLAAPKIRRLMNAVGGVK